MITDIAGDRECVMGNSFKLSETGPNNYTKLERDLFALLPFSMRDKISSTELASKWQGKRNIFGRNNVLSRIRLLSTKMVENGEKVVIMKTKQRGPKPAEFWLERKRAS